MEGNVDRKYSCDKKQEARGEQVTLVISSYSLLPKSPGIVPALEYFDDFTSARL
ncbi:hypothetical protein ABHI18_001443 [Aspergillus niger]